MNFRPSFRLLDILCYPRSSRKAISDPHNVNVVL